MNQNNGRVVVLGGGYAGMMAALRLAGKTRRIGTPITLINGLDSFVERPRLHEQATGANLQPSRIEHMLRGTRVRFRQGWITAIEPDRRLVHVTSGDRQVVEAYDILVYALGSSTERTAVPGVDEFAYTLDPYGKRTAGALKAKLEALGGPPFHAAVVGGGATGVEMAAQLRGAYPEARVSLWTKEEAGDFKGPRIQRHIAAALRNQGVEIHNKRRVRQVVAKGLILDCGPAAADIVIWSGGFSASPLAREAAIKVNGRNQIITDPTLCSVSHGDIYAAGDAASPQEMPGAPMRMSLFTALVSGAQVADNIAAILKGQQPRPLSYVWYGQGIALGPDDAVGFATFPADEPVGPVYRGRAAVILRNFFLWYLKRALAIERLLPGFFFWNGKKRYERQQESRQSDVRTATS